MNNHRKLLPKPADMSENNVQIVQITPQNTAQVIIIPQNTTIFLGNEDPTPGFTQREIHKTSSNNVITPTLHSQKLVYPAARGPEQLPNKDQGHSIDFRTETTSQTTVATGRVQKINSKMIPIYSAIA